MRWGPGRWPGGCGPRLGQAAAGQRALLAWPPPRWQAHRL